MSWLAVSYGPTLDFDGDVLLPEAWGIDLVGGTHDMDSARCIAHGFARRRDAEIGVMALERTGVDWSLDKWELRRQLGTETLYEWCMKVVIEALQW